MTIQQKVNSVLDALKAPSKEELKDALLKINLTMEDFYHLPESDEGKPYYRKLIYKSEEVELLIMNWSKLECAPHDHGQSEGWIQILRGTTQNSVYEVNKNGLPSEIFQEFYAQGKLFFAPKKGIHKMKASGGTDLLTLHLYSPPITGMKVYDLEKCLACVVSDDCGAWWPEEQRQKLKEIQLRIEKSSNSQNLSKD